MKTEKQIAAEAAKFAERWNHIGADASERRNSLGVDASERRDGSDADAMKRQLLFMERDKFISIKGTTLPHWHQDNKVQFVTFRLADSLPQEKLADLSAYKEKWLAEHPEPWDEQTLEAYNHEIREKVDHWLDQGYGECLLGREEVRKVVIDALLFFHGQRYVLHHFVIMPNHVHLLLSPIGDDEVTKSIGSVKQYTSNAINKLLGSKGDIWQRNIFDRMVRNAKDYEKYVLYIRHNPIHLLSDQYSLDLGVDASERRNNSHTDARKRQLL